MHERLNKGIFFGIIGNILFILFGLICYLFYVSYDPESIHSRVLEALAYIAEVTGFVLLIYSSRLMFSAVRMRNLLKLGFSAYIVLESVMMFLEINTARFSFYAPYSLALAIVHSVLSAAVCFSFIQFDPDKPKLEAVVIVCTGIMLGGMFGNIMGIRVYFSIISNAVGFLILFSSIRYLIGREEIEIDCHGDNARVVEYSSSTFFGGTDEKDDGKSN
ncbi:MAG: hypothetical protein IJ666_01375 [Ruminococcus sp.]|nr:hypothetical protein [Ruminococcus sp.]